MYHLLPVMIMSHLHFYGDIPACSPSFRSRLHFPNLSDFARWLLRLLPHLSRFKNQFFFSFFTMYIMHISFYIGQWPCYHQHLFPTLNRHLYPAPNYSDSTNAFIDAVHLPPPDLADEEALMDELMEPNLPGPHQHVAAPPPDALPDPSKLSAPASTPPKRKQKAKATPKAPVKRRRHHEQSRSRSSSPLTTWTADEKQKLRTLKSDEKSRFSWRVISTKMGKTEADVRSMWNKLKDQLG